MTWDPASKVKAALARARRLAASMRCTRPPADPLDRPLFPWDARNDYTRRSLLQSLFVMGASGSGKTSGPGRHVARALIRDRKVGGLILASKPEDRAMWQAWFAEAGREDLIVFGPGGPHRFGLLDHESRFGDARELAQCLMTVGETLGRDGEGDGQDPFWRQQYRRVLINGIEVVKRATGVVTPWGLQKFIAHAAQSPDEMKSPNWLAGPHQQCLELASRQPMTAVQAHDFALASQFWLGEWPALNDRTRSSILAGVLGLLHVFNTGVVRDLIGGESTISPAVLDEGKWVLVDMPVGIHGVAGAFCAGAWKWAVQKHVLRRDAAPCSPITCLWIDEYQNHVTSFDATYLAECRSHHGYMVVLTQSLHSFFAAMTGRQGQHQAEALLTNFGTKIFTALGDTRSAEYASGLVGTALQVMVDTSTAPPRDIYAELFTAGLVTRSTSTKWEPVLQPCAFLSGLRTGGPGRNDFIVDAVVVRGGDTFADGRGWRRAAFRQIG